MSALAGQVAVVTAGAAGIGRALAETFQREGARVAVCDVDPETKEKINCRQIDKSYEVDRVIDVAFMARTRTTMRKMILAEVILNQ